MGRIFVSIVVLTVLCGCAAEKRIGSIPNTFLEDVNIKAKRENLPFDHSWVKKGKKGVTYNQIYIKPIRLDKLHSEGWKNSMSPVITSRADYEHEAKEIARYFKEQLEEKMLAQPNPRFRLVRSPGPRTLVLEIALTELEFSHPIARAGALAVPVPGTGAALSAISDPHMCFAARFTDAQTGELLATAADRKFPPTRIVDLNKFTVTSSAREIAALWSESLSQAIQGRGMGKVSEERFSLIPW